MSADPSPNSEFSQRLEIERILDAFERELQAGRRPDRQAILPPDPELREQVDAELQRIEGEYHARNQLGEAKTLAGSPEPIAVLRSPGGSLGPYELLELLGKGGMGTVFKARHTRLGKFVAVKVLPPHLVRSVDALARFDREMKAVGALEHPNIVRATDADEHLGTHYLVMEYIDGRDLQQIVKEDGPLPIAEACRLVRDAALALDHAHRNGLIHRDIKPSNLLRTKAGQLKVLDLGLARLAAEGVPQEGLTDTGVSLGTPDYMAPEQWNDSHAADARTDLYALGCTLFYLLVGRAPYATEQYRTLIGKMAAHAEAPIPSLRTARPETPPALERLIQKLLAKKAAERVQSAAELAELLGPWAKADFEPKLATLPPKRSNFRVLFAGAIAIAIAAGATAVLYQRRNPPAPSPVVEPQTGSATATVPSTAQHDLPPSTSITFGEWAEAVNLGPIVNSTASDGGSALSADGLSLFFHSSRAGNNDLWVSTRPTVNSEWTAPVSLGDEVNTAMSEEFPCISTDGLTLLFASDRRGGRGGWDVWTCRRKSLSEPFDSPVPMPGEVNSVEHERRTWLSLDGLTLRFDVFNGIQTKIYESKRAGLSEPFGLCTVMANPVNGDGYRNYHPTLSADELELVCATIRTDGLGKDDLWMYRRSSVQESFDEGLNLGPKVNSSASDMIPTLSADGMTLIFTSSRPGGQGSSDLWMCTRQPVAADIAPTSPVAAPPNLLTADGWLDVMPLITDQRLDRSFKYAFRNDWRREGAELRYLGDEKQGHLRLPLEFAADGYEIELDFTVLKQGELRLAFTGASRGAMVELASGNRPHDGPKLAPPLLNRRRSVRIRHQKDDDWWEILVDRESVFDGRLTLKPNEGFLQPANSIAIDTGPQTEFLFHALRVKPIGGEVLLRQVPPLVGETPAFVKLALPSSLAPAPQLTPGQPVRQMFRREPIVADSVAWSSDGTWIACGDREGVLRLYDGVDFSLRRILNAFPQQIGKIYPQPNGSKLLVFGSGVVVSIWDMTTGTCNRILEAKPFHAAWRHDGQSFAIGEYYEGVHGLSIWSSEGRLQKTSPNNVWHSLAWTRDNNLIFVTNGSKLFRYDLAEGKTVACEEPELAGHLAAHPSEDVLAISRRGSDGENYLEFWNYDERKQISIIKAGARRHWATSLAFNPQGDVLASAAQHAHSETTKWRTGDNLSYRNLGKIPNHVSWNSAGDHYAVSLGGCSHFAVIPCDPKAPVRYVGTYGFYGVNLSPNQRDLMRLTKEAGTDKLLVQSGTATSIFKGKCSPTANVWSPSGKLFLHWSAEGTGRLLDAENGHVVGRLAGPPANYQTAAFSEDETLLAAADKLDRIQIWKRDGSAHCSLNTAGRAVGGFAFSPDAQQLAVSHPQQKAVQLWDLESQTAGVNLEFPEAVSQIHWYDPDAFVAHAAGKIYRWKRDATSPEKVASEVDHLIVRRLHPGNPWLMKQDTRGAFVESLDGKQTIYLEHLPSLGAREVKLLTPDNGEELSLFCQNHVIRTWNSETGKLVRQLVLLANDQTITLDPAGNVLAKTEHADREVIWADSRPDGTFDVKVEAP